MTSNCLKYIYDIRVLYPRTSLNCRIILILICVLSSVFILIWYRSFWNVTNLEDMSNLIINATYTICDFSTPYTYYFACDFRSLNMKSSQSCSYRFVSEVFFRIMYVSVKYTSVVSNKSNKNKRIVSIMITRCKIRIIFLSLYLIFNY